MRQLLLALALAGLSLPAVHAADSATPSGRAAAVTARSPIEQWVLDGALAYNADPDVRNAFRDILLRQAEQKNATARYIAGVLYRLGHAHPAKLVPQNLDKSREYLLAAALDGMHAATFKLAEVEYQAGRYAEAMDWAQVHMHYLREQPGFDPRDAKGAAALISRIAERLGTVEHETIRQRTITLLDRYGATIEAAHQARQATSPPPPQLQIPGGKRRVSGLSHTAVPPTESGNAEFYIAVDHEGRVSRFWLLDGGADGAFAETFAPIVRRSRFNPSKPGDAPRVALVPFAYLDRSYELQQR
ncbi:hypothetical protein [Tahibacter amnicola]|uniref:Sel1 repeat-containing protein n=1 Tax=Tahibacter amnicola TaxID=2976241 RepID=A0ABY6BHR4_9GAMM|nr:hypothetical protein [Tahibacter amnicola]UXI68878.1 hypothetical protein N4264_04270 [Tahibacter amnicola]